MNTEKITAALVVLMMMATGACLLPQDLSGEDSEEQGVPDMEVGDIIGMKMGEKYNLRTILNNMGPVIDGLLNKLAEIMEMDKSELVEALSSILPEKSAELLNRIVADPENVEIKKADFIKLMNDLIGFVIEGVSVSDFNVKLSYEILSATEKISEHEYRTLTTAEITVGLLLTTQSTNPDIPALTLEDGEISIKALGETYVNLGMYGASVSTDGILDIRVSGKSNFIDDKAESFGDMFKILPEARNFSIPLTITGNASAYADVFPEPVLTEVGDTDETKISVAVALELKADSTNPSIKSLVEGFEVDVDTEQSFECTATFESEDEETGRTYIFSVFPDWEVEDDTTPAIVFATNDNVHEAIYLGQQLSFAFINSEDPKFTTLSFVIYQPDEQMIGDDADEGIVPEEVLFSFGFETSPESTSISVNETVIDLTEILKKIRSTEVSYGEDYIMTPGEVRSFEKDVSKIAYALDYDIKGFNGENLNVDPESLDKFAVDPNILIAVVIVVAFLIAAFAATRCGRKSA